MQRATALERRRLALAQQLAGRSVVGERDGVKDGVGAFLDGAGRAGAAHAGLDPAGIDRASPPRRSLLRWPNLRPPRGRFRGWRRSPARSVPRACPWMRILRREAAVAVAAPGAR